MKDACEVAYPVTEDAEETNDGEVEFIAIEVDEDKSSVERIPKVDESWV